MPWSGCFYRLSVVPIELPPLRHRKGDIPLLCDLFLREGSPEETVKLTTAARAKIGAYMFPGNVRELLCVMMRALLMGNARRAGRREIGVADIVFWQPDQSPSRSPVQQDKENGRYLYLPGRSLDECCMEIVVHTYRECGENTATAARLLGISRNTLAKWLADRQE